MSKQINIKSYQTTPGKSISGGNSGGAGSASSPSGSGVSRHEQLDGIVSSGDEYSQFARDIHLTGADADVVKRYGELDIITSTDEEKIPSDFTFYSALKSQLEDERIAKEMEDKYIRKDKPDETDHRVDFHDGITTGSYLGGFLGSGSIIDKDGNAEMTSLKLREFLEVPELRFNRIDVVSGELWNSIAFGLIESVEEQNRIVTLHLEEGELSGLHVNDFCRGIFHNLTGNAEQPGKDGSGFDTLVGFSTAYFTPVEIIDNARFKYELKPGTTVHPCVSMKFAVYGNALDKSRQHSAYQTRTYTRFLRNVDTWEIDPGKHVSFQAGDLSNLVIDGQPLADGSVYLNNVYFGGNILTVGGLDSLKGKDAYSVTLSTYSAVYNIADGIYEQAEVVTKDQKVVTGASQVLASQFNVSTRLQVTKGEEQLRYSEVIGQGKYVVTSSGTNCTYIITDGLVAVQEVTADHATINIQVNCEGIATYDVVFTIVRVADGKDGKDYEYIYARTSTYSPPQIKKNSQDDGFVPEDWTDNPVGVTSSFIYEWVSNRKKINGVWGDFRPAVLWAKYSFDGEKGESGNDGRYQEVRYKRSSTQPNVIGNPPSGWALDPPTSGTDPIWVTSAIFNGDGTLYSRWSAAVRWSGQDGSKGDKGETGPSMTYRGVYDSAKTYVGSPIRVDVVEYKVGDKNHYFVTLPDAGSIKDVVPTNTNKWKSAGDQFESIATGMLIAKEALISGWRFKEDGNNRYIESQNSNVILDGSADVNIPKIALGTGYADRKNAPLRLYEDGRAVIKKGEIAGFIIENGWLKANSALSADDIGYIDMRSSDTRIAFGTGVGNPYSTTKCTAYINNSQPHSGGSGVFAEENIAMYLRSWSADENTALDCIGGLRWIGRTMNVNQPIVVHGNAMLDVIEVKIRYANEYVLDPYDYVAVNLPDASTISKAFGAWVMPEGGSTEDSSIIQINIMVPRYSLGTLLIRGVSGAPLINQNGDLISEDSRYSYGNIKMEKGDQLCLVYMNRAWYIRYRNS